MNTRDHQSTQSLPTRAHDAIYSVLEVPNTVYQQAKSGAVDAAHAALNAQKIVLSEAGVMRQMAEAPGGVSSNDSRRQKNPTPQYHEQYSASTSDTSARIDRARGGYGSDPILDSVFLCGDFYAPLSIQYSISATKIVDDSQLVDGINITQRVAKGPKIINISFPIERLEPLDGAGSDDSTTIRRRPEVGNTPYSVYNLTSFLGELYDSDEVFAIENTVLNNEMGVEWAFIKNFRFEPRQGSTLADITIVLQEVNIYDPLLYVNADNNSAFASVPTTKTP